MPEFDAELARMLHLANKPGFDRKQPCKVVLPRLDAKERIRNERKQRRIVLVTDEFGFSQFHARKEAWMLALENNPVTFMAALDAAMADFNVKGWREEQEGETGSLGDA
jgi:hypothetical protein